MRKKLHPLVFLAWKEEEKKGEKGFYFKISPFPKGFENLDIISENAGFLFHNLWQFFLN